MDNYKPYIDWLDSQSEEMVSLLKTWASINTHTLHHEGVRKMGAALQKEFHSLGASFHEQILPHTVAFSFIKRPEAKRKILLVGHMDTVYPVDSPFQDLEMIDSQRLRGPGVADMKGGLVVLLKALQAFERSPYSQEIGWEVFINSDEEIGSPYSSPILKKIAPKYNYGLVFEPTLPSGDLVSERKGSLNLSVTVKGKTAHVGRHYHEGVSAIYALSSFIHTIEKEIGEDLIINIGKIWGGVANNVVPDLATCTINVRSSSHEKMNSCRKKMDDTAIQLMGERPGVTITIEEHVHRPPKPFDAKTKALFEEYAQCAKLLGEELTWKESGGVCDGNIMAAAGLPTIDTLGVNGGNIHTDDEFVDLKSLPRKAKLTTLFLMRYADHKKGEFTDARL
jgi:glutamate carboxypeptidase